MRDQTTVSGGRGPLGRLLLRPGVMLGLLIAMALVIVSTAVAGKPDAGILPLFLAIPMVLWLRGQDFRTIGLGRPASWLRTLRDSLLLGLGAQLVAVLAVNPLIEQFTRVPVDLTPFDGIRGNLRALLTLLAIVWAVAVFVEEVLFRGFLMTDLKRLLGDSPLGLAANLTLSSTLFGLAHWYQGVSGVIGTGFIGLILGYLFIRQGFNLWLVILVHGFLNTAGLILIYLNADRYLEGL